MMPYIACRAGVFMASERSDFLREMFGRHLGFFRQRKVGERNKFLPNMAAQWTMALALPDKTPALQAMPYMTGLIEVVRKNAT